MKTYILFCAFLFLATSCYAQMPAGKNFGFGAELGEPSGITVKYWTDKTHALGGTIGSSYYGSPRIDVDYYWHYNAFNSSVVNLFVSVGGVLGFGDYRDGWWYKKDKYESRKGKMALGARGAIGINILPRTVPLEIFVELGVVESLLPFIATSPEAAFGVRFYP